MQSHMLRTIYPTNFYQFFYAIFIFSDLLIGMKDIKGIDIPFVSFAIWFTYIIALSGIAYVLVSYKEHPIEK